MTEAASWRTRSATAAVSLLVLASIVLLPDAFVRWFLPKDALAAIAITLSSVAVSRGRLPAWFVIGSSCAAALALASVLMSAAPGPQLWGRWPRYEGLVTLPVYFGAVWAGARLLGSASSASAIRSLVRAVAVSAIALGAVSVLEATGARPIASDLARPGALTGNATDQGILGALLLALLALPTLRSWGKSGSANVSASVLDRGLLTAGALFAALSVILSASRAGLLAGAVVLTVLTALEIARAGRQGGGRLLAVGGGALLVLLGGAMAVPLTRDRLLGASPLSTRSIEGRFDFWRESRGLLADHPLGVGSSGFLNAAAPSSTAGSTLDSPHSWVFQVALAGGLPLLVLVLTLVLAVAGLGFRRWRSATTVQPGRADILAGAIAGLAGYGLALLTHFTAPSTTILAALLVGMLVAAAPSDGLHWRLPEGARRTLLSRMRTVALAIWAVWLVTVLSADVSLGAAVSAAANGDLDRARTQFESAQRLRPWDADLASIAAQSFAAAADGGLAEAAGDAIAWAERSRATLPNTVATERALATGQLAAGDPHGAERTLATLSARAPLDAVIASQHALSLCTIGDIPQCTSEVDRAFSLDPDDIVALRLRDWLG